uniref:Peptide hydrolase n=1 Tax=Ganoderma boninense TaxID=34458 RepID=A0A5K1K705_9APHY|nr:Structural maintenance of chromosomes protein [Ganoderma boninense]
MLAAGHSAAVTLLLISLADLKLDALPRAYNCLRDSYHGIHGGRHAFILDETCRTSSFSLLGLGTSVQLASELLRPYPTAERWSGPGWDLPGAQNTVSALNVKDEGGPSPVSDKPVPTFEAGAARHLVWLERTRVDPALYDAPFDTELGWVLGNLTAPPPNYLSHPRSDLASPVAQRVLDTPNSAFANKAFLLARRGGTPLRFWRYSVFPKAPIPLYPVPKAAKEKLRAVLPGIKFDPVIASVVNGISVSQLRDDIRHLTGEAPSSDIDTRHTLSAGALRAAEWLRERIEETGALCEFRHFQEGWAPNVVCTYGASTDTTDTIILGAHYDDRGSSDSGSTRAPGANDDGSGTGALVGIARAIANGGVVFRKRVQLVAFAGEEQGMVGSRVYARELKEAGANVTMMIQADMLAYHVEGEPLQLGLSDPALVGTAEVTQILANISAIYSPELTVGYSPYPGGSDHQRFYEYGFAAAQVYERIGLIKDPMYHNTGDVSERDGYDFDQIKSIAKVEFAAVLHVAGFDLSERTVGGA